MTNWERIETYYTEMASVWYEHRPDWMLVGKSMLVILPQLRKFVSQHEDLMAYLSHSAFAMKSDLTGYYIEIYPDGLELLEDIDLSYDIKSYKIMFYNLSGKFLSKKSVLLDSVIKTLSQFLYNT